MSVLVETVEEVCERVLAGPVRVRGGGTMTALAPSSSASSTLDLRGLRGVVEHDPSEFTITVMAGTTVQELDHVLAEAGQVLPCDPPLAAHGATVGGMVAGGLSGSGRYRFGGVRDFVLGVQFVDGRGRALRGGGRVVKNAAGFDLPKLMVGSLGSFGVLVSVTLKVFPRPEARRTLRVECGDIARGVEAIRRIGTGFDPEAVDLESDGTLWIRLSARQGAMTALVARAQELFEGAELVPEAAGETYWGSGSELEIERQAGIGVKVPLTPSKVVPLDEALGERCRRRYVAGAQQAWVAWPRDRSVDELDEVLSGLGLSAMAVLGEVQPFLGRPIDRVVAARLKRVLDPEGRFRPL